MKDKESKGKKHMNHLLIAQLLYSQQWVIFLKNDQYFSRVSEVLSTSVQNRLEKKA